MNIIGGNITLVIDPLEKAIGYRNALILFWPVLAAVGMYTHTFISQVQGWAKEWTLGCVNSASLLPLDAGGQFTQLFCPALYCITEVIAGSLILH